MVKAFVEAPGQIESKEMHKGGAKGRVVFAMPVYGDDSDSDIVSKTGKEGMYVGIQYDDETMQKFKDGTYTGFSIGGSAQYEYEEAA